MIDEKTVVIDRNDSQRMRLLSDDVIECMEMLDAFSLGGKYIDITETESRMSIEQAEIIKDYYYRIFRYAYNNKRIKLRKVKKLLKPIKGFIIGIYKNGTPAYRYESKRVSAEVDDSYIIEEFSLALIERLTEYTR